MRTAAHRHRPAAHLTPARPLRLNLMKQANRGHVLQGAGEGGGAGNDSSRGTGQRVGRGCMQTVTTAGGDRMGEALWEQQGARSPQWWAAA